MADILPHEDRQNKRAVREMFRDAFERLGGVDWLVTFATRSDENARVFISALTKLIPLEVTGKDGQPLTITVVTEVGEQVVTAPAIEGESRLLQ